MCEEQAAVGAGSGTQHVSVTWLRFLRFVIIKQQLIIDTIFVPAIGCIPISFINQSQPVWSGLIPLLCR